VSVVAKAYDSRESAKYAFETYIYDDDETDDLRIVGPSFLRRTL